MADASAVLLAAALQLKVNKEEELRKKYDITQIPQLLVEELHSRLEDEALYSGLTDNYNEQQYKKASSYVKAIPPNCLGHSELSCITSARAFPSLCGYTFAEFDRLFHSLKAPLKYCFPRAKSTDDDLSKFCSRRMKLFLFLFRCKLGASFMQMEGLFGWPKSSLQDWFLNLALNIPVAIRRYNKGFLRWKGPDWQRAAATEWSQRILS